MIHDEIRQQQEKMKDKSIRARLEYFWYYYKIPVLAGSAAALLCLLFIFALIREARNPSIYVALINSSLTSASQTTLVTGFADSRGLDVDAHPARLDYSMHMSPTLTDDLSVAASQQLMTHMNSGDVDVYFGDQWLIDEYASLDAYENLENCLPSALLEKLGNKLYYAEVNGKGRLPVAIYADELAIISQESIYPDDTRPLIAISRTSHRKEIAADFILYLFYE